MKKILLTFIVLIVLLSGCVSQIDNPTNNTNVTKNTTLIEDIIAPIINSITSRNQTNLKTFTSENQLQDYLEERAEQGGYYTTDNIFTTTTGIADLGTKSSPQVESATDYSTTNIQVSGVDEPDIVKNDGKYIYAVSREKISIIDAFPAESASLLSTIALEGVQEIFINQDKLIVFGIDYNYPEMYEPVGIAKTDMAIMPYYSNPLSFVKIYNVSNRSNPILARDLSFDGNYYDSRMIGDFVYIILNQGFYHIAEEPIPLPRIIEDNITQNASIEEIHYSDEIANPDTFTTIVSINPHTGELNKAIYLMDSAHNMYVSQNNIYTTSQKWRGDEQTIIHKISITNGQIQYQTQGEVPGSVLNQFSMDEFNENFRIATTIGHVSRSGSDSTNNIYIFDKNLAQIGSVEDLAPGERIYSARFMGARAYLVTFKKVDPLFVIDLSNPTNPIVLGKLKIPGYSDYLHPYDENHLIGLGKETVESETGDFAWYQGVKLSLFDVSDVSNPRELAKVEIGDRGTDSFALNDHRAFLFNKEKNLLVLPISLAEIDEGDYAGEVADNAYGEYTFQGAFVFDISLAGFVERGRITHVSSDELLKSGYYFQSENSVQRSLYMDNTLYTISNNWIKMNNLADLSEINSVDLQTVCPTQGC